MIRTLRSWCEDDPDEQRETWEFLRLALDGDRLSDPVYLPRRWSANGGADVVVPEIAPTPARANFSSQLIRAGLPEPP